MTLTSRRWVVLTLTLGHALAGPVWAALGGSTDSVSADANTLRGQLVSTPMAAYDLHQISTGAVVINEYVTRSGRVFAVTWRGPIPPNLRQLLGDYFARFQSAALAAHQVSAGIHRQLSIAQSDLVVQSSGRLRSFRGLAYLPSLLPTGVSVSELQ